MPQTPLRAVGSTSRRPTDTEARIGVRRNPKNPEKVEKIFGYDAIITTAIELSLGLELLSEP